MPSFISSCDGIASNNIAAARRRAELSRFVNGSLLLRGIDFVSCLLVPARLACSLVVAASADYSPTFSLSFQQRSMRKPQLLMLDLWLRCLLPAFGVVRLRYTSCVLMLFSSLFERWQVSPVGRRSPWFTGGVTSG